MSFREKIAWLTLGAMIVAYSVYFALIPTIWQSGDPPVVSMIALFAAVTIAQAVVVGVTAAVLALRARDEAQAPADERERAIDRRGAGIAYYVLMVGMILVGVVMPFGAGGWRIANAALFALVVAEVVRNGIVVISYRRGWHG